MSFQDNQTHSNKSTLIVIISLTIILAILFGLNTMLSKQNKGNINVINKIDNNLYLKGEVGAKVKLVEYVDLQCSACKFYAPIINKLYNEINNEYGSSSLSIAYKHFPLIQIHKNAFAAAYAVEAALSQGKFWEMHDLLFEKQADWSESLDAKSIFEGYAVTLGLDLNKFKLARDSEEVKNKIDLAYKEGIKIGLNHTPTIFLNGIEAKDTNGYEGLKSAILEKLNVSSSSIKSEK